MYTLIRGRSARRVLLDQAPSAGGALVIAEVAYKFHSFTLKCLAFLATWFVLDFVSSRIVERWGRMRRPAPSRVEHA